MLFHLPSLVQTFSWVQRLLKLSSQCRTYFIECVVRTFVYKIELKYLLRSMVVRIKNVLTQLWANRSSYRVHTIVHIFALLLIKFDTLGMRFIEYLITYSFVRMMSYFNDWPGDEFWFVWLILSGLILVRDRREKNPMPTKRWLAAECNSTGGGKLARPLFARSCGEKKLKMLLSSLRFLSFELCLVCLPLFLTKTLFCTRLTTSLFRRWALWFDRSL